MPASLTAASVYGAMSDIVEALDIDGQLYVAGHNLPQFLERAHERGAEHERFRIMEMIQKRIDVHSGFVKFYTDKGRDIPPSIFSSLMELRALLREIEREEQ